MKRTPIIAGNWKMFMLKGEAAALVNGLLESLSGVADREVVVCPTYTSLDTVNAIVKETNITLGAQDVYWEDSGAFTGEISPLMLKDAGVKYVVIGHSERRQYFGETNETVNKRAKACYKHGLNPIICVGETLGERQSEKTMDVIKTQIAGCLEGITPEQMTQSVIAYEPVWAIGTGLTATPDQAQEVHAFIRSLLTEKYGKDVAQSVRIQYGGSVKPDNVDILMAMEDIDGALVGGASLKVDSFTKIVKFSM